MNRALARAAHKRRQLAREVVHVVAVLVRVVEGDRGGGAGVVAVGVVLPR